MVLTIVVAAAGLMVGVLLGVVIAVQKNRKSLERVKNKSEQVLLDARNEALKIKEDAEKDRNKRQEDLKELEGSLRRREESLDCEAKH